VASIVPRRPQHETGESNGSGNRSANRSTSRSHQGFHGIRYQVTDVSRAVAFYTQHLGFRKEQEHLPEIAAVSLGGVRVLLSGPGASGSRPLPAGQVQTPGGSNRVILEVSDLPDVIARLKQSGLRFRNEMETGPAGRQIQVEDPDGNPVELFEPARGPAKG
jgi:glyoxylase I family protein